MEPRQATLREMGLRTEKAIALHILQENTFESNLVSDIANAPYLRGNTGRTHLAPLPGLPPFVDDIYVYGRLEEKDIVRVGGRISCTTGPNGAAARTVSQISLFARAVWPPEEHKWIHVFIANTVATNSGTRIPQTIEGIEEEDEGRLAKTWADIHGGARAAAYFVAKLDVSELPFKALQAGLPQLQRQLVANGMALYQVDYTQDFSGTLDREELVRHLEEAHHFCYQDEPAKENTQGCILDNTDSVGNHVCTFVWSAGNRAISTKFYNKLVLQIEAGDVRGQFGGHMSGIVASTNQHLRRTLAHRDVLARGCTRLEISIYGCLVEELDAGKAGTMLENALRMATPEGAGPDTGLFVVQPTSKQWENYASCLDRCFVLADRPQGAICTAWSGSSKTGRIQGGVGVPAEGPGRKKCVLAKSHPVGHVRLCPPALPNLLDRDPRGRRWGRGLCPTTLLHQGRAHNLVCEHQTLRVAHKRTQPARAASPNPSGGVGLANPKDPQDRGETSLLRLDGSARDGGHTTPLHTIHKGSLRPSSRTRGRRPAYCAGPACAGIG